MKKKVLIVVGIVLIIGLSIGGKFFLDFQDYKNKVASIEIENIDLTEVADGSYIGSYDAVFIKVEVQVDVQDHKIINIDLLQHENGKGVPAEAIIYEVIKAQSTEVDAISGATSSSRVILKSIEIALASPAL